MDFCSCKIVHMKKIVALFILLSSLIACTDGPGVNVRDVELSQTERGIYFWKTKFALNDYEEEFLRTHKVSKLYIKMFDVALQKDPGNDTLSIVPIATTRFGSSIPERVDVIPTVYITYDALLHLSRQNLSYQESYVRRILTRIDAMSSYNNLPNVKEVQFDCDWTSTTSYDYYVICKIAKKILNSNGKQFSITLRLHQMDDDRIPPADRGVLMLYNTGSFKNPKSSNSILTYNDAQPYISKHKIPFPVDYAYPTYSWSLLFRDNEFKCIVRNLDLNDEVLYQKSDYNKFIVQKDTLIAGNRLLKGDMIRHETAEFKEIERVKSYLSSRHDIKNSRQIIYHLDSTNLSKYSDDEIKYIYMAY